MEHIHFGMVAFVLFVCSWSSDVVAKESKNKCKKVTIKAFNVSDYDIKFLRAHYYDNKKKKWRIIFWGSKKRKPKAKSKFKSIFALQSKHLSHLSYGEKSRLKFTVKVKSPTKGWSKKGELVGSFTCEKNPHSHRIFWTAYIRNDDFHWLSSSFFK